MFGRRRPAVSPYQFGELEPTDLTTTRGCKNNKQFEAAIKGELQPFSRDENTFGSNAYQAGKMVR